MYDGSSKRWELDSDNVLATNMLDTIVPAMVNDIQKSASEIRSLNSILHKFLPLTRREELLEYERDLRVRQTVAWRYIHDWVLEGLQTFLTQSIRLLDILESHRTSRKSVTEVVQSVYEQAVIVGDRCLCGRNHSRDTSRIYEQLGGVLQLYADNPIPKIDLESSSWAGYVIGVIAGTPPHSPPEVFKHLISLNDQIRIGSELINTALDDLTDFFNKLTQQFNPDELNANSTAKLDLRSLRQRWTRLQEEIKQGKEVVSKAEKTTSDLPEPLYL
ncbi:hypothetical protein FRB96_001732 [Tulasnella sp. 330]|nr:hypothetical protein FRB96_001732 [Tulasnella sp. 330]KAG8882363.1 hypothetical protein FRB97_008377 [Tulasnella sp. 331]KAG8886830.1 hypothetical protein FRB98_000966 [Tulasnella sp. 332]